MSEDDPVWVQLYFGEQDGFRTRVGRGAWLGETVYLVSGTVVLIIEMTVEEHRSLQGDYSLLAYTFVDEIARSGERARRYNVLSSSIRSWPDAMPTTSLRVKCEGALVTR